MNRFKHIIYLFLFIVTYNQWGYFPKYEHVPGIITAPAYYSIEITTQTIRLGTQQDVDRFIGLRHNEINLGEGVIWRQPVRGIISPDAFNIKVKEIEK